MRTTCIFPSVLASLVFLGFSVSGLRADTLFFTTEFGEVGQLNANGSTSDLASVSQSEGIAYSGGFLYVASNNSDVISKVSLNGTVSDFATVTGGINGLAFDAKQNLYAADYSDGSILKISPTGSVSTFYSGINQPEGLAFDALGNLFVSDPSVGDIFKIDTSGNKTVFATDAAFPQGLACDQAGNLYVANNQSQFITKISPDGTVDATFADVGFGGDGLTIDSDGNLFLANLNAAQIEKILPDGTVGTFVTLSGQQPIFITTPEPPTLWLVLIGVAVFAVVRVRTKVKSLA